MSILMSKNGRGFPTGVFLDANGERCSIQCSSAIDFEAAGSYENPGTGYLWLGIDDAKPQIMATDAKRLGIETAEDSGWIAYPVPKEVLMTTRMHLNRPQVRDLIETLQCWLEADNLDRFLSKLRSIVNGGDDGK